LTRPGRISVVNLTKVFDLQKRRKGRSGVSSREVMALMQMFRAVFRLGVKEHRRFYALRNISLDVGSGEIMGIIGRNGAGKSTLLKILARVIDPTEGSIRVEGRVASLLELGAGFNAELTVAENISLQVSFQGGKEDPELVQEILELADLVDYRDVELDDCPGPAAPRLAFATLVTLASEVVLADEMLAVGNQQFKQLVIDRIQKVKDDGGCVLFVSHDLDAITRLCDRVMWLDRGATKMVGPAREVVEAYEAEIRAKTAALDPAGDAAARIVDLRLTSTSGRQIGAMSMKKSAYIECLFQHLRPAIPLRLRFEVRSARKKAIYSDIQTLEAYDGDPSAQRARVKIPSHFLNAGSYIGRAVIRWEAEDGQRREVQDKVEFTAADTETESSIWGDYEGDRRGLIAPRLNWSHRVTRLREPREGEQGEQ